MQRLLLTCICCFALLASGHAQDGAVQLTDLGDGTDGSTVIKSLHSGAAGLFANAGDPGNQATAAYHYRIDPVSGGFSPLRVPDDTGTESFDVEDRSVAFREAGGHTFLLRNNWIDPSLSLVTEDNLVVLDRQDVRYLNVVDDQSGGVYIVAFDDRTGNVILLQSDLTAGGTQELAQGPAIPLSWRTAQFAFGDDRILISLQDGFSTARQLEYIVGDTSIISSANDRIRELEHPMDPNSLLDYPTIVSFSNGFFYTLGSNEGGGFAIRRFKDATSPVTFIPLSAPAGSPAFDRGYLIEEGGELYFHVGTDSGFNHGLIGRVDGESVVELGPNFDISSPVAGPIVDQETGEIIFGVRSDVGMNILRLDDQDRLRISERHIAREQSLHRMIKEEEYLYVISRDRFGDVDTQLSYYVDNGSFQSRILADAPCLICGRNAFAASGSQLFYLTENNFLASLEVTSGWGRETIGEVRTGWDAGVGELVLQRAGDFDLLWEGDINTAYRVPRAGGATKLPAPNGESRFFFDQYVPLGERVLLRYFGEDILYEYRNGSAVPIPEVVTADGQRVTSSGLSIIEPDPISDKPLGTAVGFARGDIAQALGGGFNFVLIDGRGEEIVVRPIPRSLGFVLIHFDPSDGGEPYLVTRPAAGSNTYSLLNDRFETLLTFEHPELQLRMHWVDDDYVYLHRLRRDFGGPNTIVIVDRKSGELFESSVPEDVFLDFNSEVVTNGVVYAGRSTGGGWELYTVAPVDSSAVALPELAPGVADGYLYQLGSSPYAGHFVFAGRDGEGNVGTYWTDGAPNEAPERLSGVIPTPEVNPHLTDEALFFSGRGPVGDEVYRLLPDGRLDLIADVIPGATSSQPRDFNLLDGRLYFQARNDSTGTYEVFQLPMALTVSTDGEVAGGLSPAIFPNPVGTEPLTVRAPENERILQVEVYGVDGRRLLQRSGLAQDQVRIDVSHLPAGQYWVKTRYASGRYAVSGIVRGG